MYFDRLCYVEPITKALTFYTVYGMILVPILFVDAVTACAVAFDILLMPLQT